MNPRISDYSKIEIGMLAGTAIGGVFALIGYLASKNVAFLLVSLIGALAGTAVGKILENRHAEVRILSDEDKQHSVD